MRGLDRLGRLCGVLIITSVAALLWEWRIGVGAGQSGSATHVTNEICLNDLFQGYRHSMDDWNERDELASTDTMWRQLLDCQASIKQRSGRLSW